MAKRTVLTRDVRDALRERARDATLPETRRARLLEMADAMDMFCQGVDGEMFDRPGTPWPEADITIVDWPPSRARATTPALDRLHQPHHTVEQHRRGATSSSAGRSSTSPTGHIITRTRCSRLTWSKITKMWRKLGAWYWLATQNIDDLPKAAEPMLNMIEWWICLSMPPDEVEDRALPRAEPGAEGADAVRPQGRPASSAKA